jgi:hypothetical protein
MVKKTRNKCLFTEAMSDASFVKRIVWAGKNAIFSFPSSHATPSKSLGLVHARQGEEGHTILGIFPIDSTTRG